MKSALMRSTMMMLLAGLAGGSMILAQSNPLSAELQAQYETNKAAIMKSADRMPDADYSFKPAEGNTRTFAQIIGHIADAHFALCGAAKGEQKQGTAERTKTSKADLTAVLKESFEYCDTAYNSLTDASGVQMIKMFGRDQTRLSALWFNLSHDQEMYGQVVVYYRAKNLVPPTTADRPAPAGGKKKQ